MRTEKGEGSLGERKEMLILLVVLGTRKRRDWG